MRERLIKKGQNIVKYFLARSFDLEYNKSLLREHSFYGTAKV